MTAVTYPKHASENTHSVAHNSTKFNKKIISDSVKMHSGVTIHGFFHLSFEVNRFN